MIRMTEKHNWITDDLCLIEETTGVKLYGTVCKDMDFIAKQLNDANVIIRTLEKRNEKLKSRVNDLEWILGIISDITPVYWGDRKFNHCICKLMGNQRQKSVLNFLYKHYRENDDEKYRFDRILREQGVKYGKYGWEKND